MNVENAHQSLLLLRIMHIKFMGTLVVEMDGHYDLVN